MAFVHGTTAAEAEPWFVREGLEDVPRISDPSLTHYRAFGLATTGVAALVNPAVWSRGAVSAWFPQPRLPAPRKMRGAIWSLRRPLADPRA